MTSTGTPRQPVEYVTPAGRPVSPATVFALAFISRAVLLVSVPGLLACLVAALAGHPGLLVAAGLFAASAAGSYRFGRAWRQARRAARRAR